MVVLPTLQGTSIPFDLVGLVICGREVSDTGHSRVQSTRPDTRVNEPVGGLIRNDASTNNVH